MLARLAPAFLLGLLVATPAAAADARGEHANSVSTAAPLLVIEHPAGTPPVAHRGSDATRRGSPPHFIAVWTPQFGSVDLRQRYRAVIIATEIRMRLPRGLLDALVAEESGYLPRAVSRRGAIGLVQLMPETARSLGVSDPFDALSNVEAGGRYLCDLLKRFGSITLALAAYNAGPGAVVRAGGMPPFPETRRHVARVLARWSGIMLGATRVRAASTSARTGRRG